MACPFTAGTRSILYFFPTLTAPFPVHAPTPFLGESRRSISSRWLHHPSASSQLPRQRPKRAPISIESSPRSLTCQFNRPIEIERTNFKIYAHQSDRLIFQRRDDDLAILSAKDVRAFDRTARHTGMRRIGWLATFQREFTQRVAIRYSLTCSNVPREKFRDSQRRETLAHCEQWLPFRNHDM